MTVATRTRDKNAFGQLLQRWRLARGKSQLGLAAEAEVSPRHVSFVETGRANPSRQMVLVLASALEVPLRERNALLLAAGFAPVYRESRLDDEELGPARRALDLILRHHEPFPAVVMNRHWDVVMRNDGAARFFSWLLGERLPASPNVVRSMFDPALLRPFVENWDVVAEALVQRVHREAVGGAEDDAARALLAEVLAYPGVPARWRTLDPEKPPAPFVAIHFVKGDLAMRWFSTVTTLGTPQDVTLEELRVESFFPADEETARAAERMRASAVQV